MGYSYYNPNPAGKSVGDCPYQKPWAKAGKKSMPEYACKVFFLVICPMRILYGVLISVSTGSPGTFCRIRARTATLLLILR